MNATETSRLLSSRGRDLEEDSFERGQSGKDSKSKLSQNEIIKSIAFGGFDGLLSSLTIISGAAGGELPWKSIVIVGISAIIANSISVGISEFLSSKAHKEFIQAEKRRELWEFKNYKDGEIQEMVNRFEARGMGRKDAELVVSKMAQYESFFVSLMITEELGTPLPEENDWALFFDAFIMFFAFGLFGCIPVSVYLLGENNSFSDIMLLEYSVLISIALLCVLGIVKSTYSSSNIYYAIVETLGLGLICSSVSFAVGSILVNTFD